MIPNQTISLTRTDSRYPVVLCERLGTNAPASISALGNLDLLSLHKTALFCSSRCPGNVILQVYDQAVRWRDKGRCVIGGFHSLVEKECLRILLRGHQPIIICPARGLENFRIPAEWKTPLSEGHLLILSCFGKQHRRVTANLAVYRNEFVAALADEVYFAHITPGGQSERLTHHLTKMARTFLIIEKPQN